MAAITLRGLDHASTLLLIDSKRHTFAGTPSNDGEGYLDANIIPAIALKQIEILKEGSTSIYASDAVAVVINVMTNKAVIVASKPAVGILDPISQPNTSPAPANPTNTPTHCCADTFSSNIGPLNAFVRTGCRVTINAAIAVGIPIEIE